MLEIKKLRFNNLMKKLLGLDQRGLSIIELLISVSIGLIVIGAGLELYLNQHKAWIIEEQISEMQQSGRAAIEDLSRNIMMSGYKLPKGVNPVIASNTNPDTITILYMREDVCQATIEWPMPLPSSELRCDGHDISCFEENTWAYIYDPNTMTGEFFYITEVQISASHIQHNTMDLSKCYPVGSQVMMVDFYKYYLDISTDPNHPNLIRMGIDMTPQVYAENIEDLQFRYGLANGVYVDVPVIGNIVREVQISLRARTSRQDLQIPGYRKRTFASSVKVRNLGL